MKLAQTSSASMSTNLTIQPLSKENAMGTKSLGIQNFVPESIDETHSRLGTSSGIMDTHKPTQTVKAMRFMDTHKPTQTVKAMKLAQTSSASMSTNLTIQPLSKENAMGTKSLGIQNFVPESIDETHSRLGTSSGIMDTHKPT